MLSLDERRYEIVNDRNAYYEEFLSGMMQDYNRQFVQDNLNSLFVICSNPRCKLIGGLHGRTLGGYLEIQAFWVAEEYHGQGIGSRLMTLAEQEALERGCEYSQIDVYDFQALKFCRNRGYKQFAALDNYFRGHTRHLLVKSLRR